MVVDTGTLVTTLRKFNMEPEKARENPSLDHDSRLETGNSKVSDDTSESEHVGADGLPDFRMIGSGHAAPRRFER